MSWKYTANSWKYGNPNLPIDQFLYIKIQGITTEIVGFITKSLELRSIVFGWILIYRNWSIFTKKCMPLCLGSYIFSRVFIFTKFGMINRSREVGLVKDTKNIFVLRDTGTLDQRLIWSSQCLGKWIIKRKKDLNSSQYYHDPRLKCFMITQWS